MSTRVFGASVTYASEAARDAASGWGVGDVVYVTGVGYTVFDGSEWGPLGASAGTATMIGPFRITYDMAGLTSQIALAALPAGTVVFRVAVRVIVAWDRALRIGAGGSTAVSGGDYQTCIQYDVPFGASSDAGSWVEGDAPTTNSVVGITTDGFLVAHVASGAAAGEADVYALIATP